MAINYSPKIVTDKLILYFDSQKTQNYVGTTVTSGIGTKTLTATSVTRSGTDTIFTNSTNSFYASSYIVDSSYDSNFVFESNKTASVFFYNTSLLDAAAPSYYRQTPFGFGQDGHKGSWNFERFYTSSDMFFRYNFDASGTYGDGIFFGTIPLNTWVNLTAVNNGDKVILYKNGVEVNSISITGLTITPTTTMKLSIGASQGSIYGFIGKVDSALFYNKALTSSEVLQNYNAMKGRYGL